jgi:2-polyprenyl-6-methoxyphenol hydroxylase-like FAD-dependent oxidoreductase
VDGGIGTGTARLVVGADGEHSLVARAVSAASYHQKPALSFACYPYWPGLPVTGGGDGLHHRPRHH